MPHLLDFKLPEFTRLGWVSPLAETVWCECLNRVKAAWQEIEISSVAKRTREACIVRASREELASKASEWRRQGIEAKDIDSPGYHSETSAAHIVRHLVYRVSNSVKVSELLCERDLLDLGATLGFPGVASNRTMKGD